MKKTRGGCGGGGCIAALPYAQWCGDCHKEYGRRNTSGSATDVVVADAKPDNVIGARHTIAALRAALVEACDLIQSLGRPALMSGAHTKAVDALARLRRVAEGES